MEAHCESARVTRLVDRHEAFEPHSCRVDPDDGAVREVAGGPHSLDEGSRLARIPLRLLDRVGAGTRNHHMPEHAVVSARTRSGVDQGHPRCRRPGAGGGVGTGHRDHLVDRVVADLVRCRRTHRHGVDDAVRRCRRDHLDGSAPSPAQT